MPRRSVSLDAVLEAATDVFAERGFVRTKVADVARRAGVATGSVYAVAASKEALFAAVFVPAHERAALPLPLPDPGVEDLQAVITTRLLAATALPLQEQALRRDRADDIAAELHALLGERFDSQASHWRLIAAVERTADDLPAVFDAFYLQGRRSFLQDLERYLTSRAAAGQLVLRADAPAVARYVVEAVAYWAYHRNQDPTASWTDDQARAVCLAMLEPALLNVPRPDEEPAQGRVG